MTGSAFLRTEECHADKKPTVPALDEVGKEENIGRHAHTMSPPRDCAPRQIDLSPSSPTLCEVGQEEGVG